MFETSAIHEPDLNLITRREYEQYVPFILIELRPQWSHSRHQPFIYSPLFVVACRTVHRRSLALGQRRAQAVNTPEAMLCSAPETSAPGEWGVGRFGVCAPNLSLSGPGAPSFIERERLNESVGLFSQPILGCRATRV